MRVSTRHAAVDMASNAFDIAPATVISRIAAAIPEAQRSSMVIIGSLAAGFHYFADRAGMQVRTKDADCLLDPRDIVVRDAASLTNALLTAGWTFHAWDDRRPGKAETPDDRIPVIRLDPPGGDGWFIEILTSSRSLDVQRDQVRVTTDLGDLQVAGFPFLDLNAHGARQAFGLKVAAPAMLSLANLLGHPHVTEVRMSQPVGGASIRRSSKDLGRVLALAWLEESWAQRRVAAWADLWASGLRACYPAEATALAKVCGSGLRELPDRPSHLADAHHAAIHGILHGVQQQPSVDDLRIMGLRLFQDAIEELPHRIAALR